MRAEGERVVATASNFTEHYEGGERVYPCRCGQTHRGDYAAYDFGHHNCFHEDELIRLMESQPNYLICPSCGAPFRVRAPQPPLARDPEWPDLPQEC